MKQDKGSQVKAKFITTIAINAYIKKKKRSLKKTINLHFKEIEIEEKPGTKLAEGKK